MAKKKTSPYLTRGRPGALKRRADETGVIWSVLAIGAVVAALLMFIGAALPEWRETSPVTYHYHYDSSGRTLAYQEAHYGLYAVYFNGRTIVNNWYRLSALMCGTVDQFIPTFSACGDTCVAHFRTRCNSYKRMTFLGYATLAVLIVSGCLALLGSAWVFVFGAKRIVLQLLWLGAGLVSLATEGFWFMQSNYEFSALIVQSQYPYPKVSTAAFIALSGSIILSMCGAWVMVSAYLADRAAWRERQAEIQRRILGEGGGECWPQGYPGCPQGGGLMGNLPLSVGFKPPGAFNVAQPPPGGGAVGGPPGGGGYPVYGGGAAGGYPGGVGGPSSLPRGALAAPAPPAGIRGETGLPRCPECQRWRPTAIPAQHRSSSFLNDAITEVKAVCTPSFFFLRASVTVEKEDIHFLSVKQL